MTGLRLLWRDWRGGELLILSAALVLAVGIVTGISLFAERINNSFKAQSSHFLAADRVLRSTNPIADQWLQRASELGLEQAQVMGFQSVVYGGESIDAPMQLVGIKAVSDSYPLRGELDVSDGQSIDVSKTTDVPALGEVWVDPRLISSLNLQIGSSLYVGEVALQVTRIVINEPDRGAQVFSVAPRVLMNIADIPRSQIVQAGSRVGYRYLFAGDAQSLQQYGIYVQARMNESQKWLQLQDAQPRVHESLQRAEQFLLLAGSLGVALAGIAIALSARRYSERHYDYVAMMKVVGASANQIMGIYSLNLITLAIIATGLGWLIGWLLQTVFFSIMQDYLQISIASSAGVKPYLIGAVTALISLLAFALPPLYRLRSISPLRVLRRDLNSANENQGWSFLLGAVGISVLMWLYSGDLLLTLAVLSGVTLTVLLVTALCWLLLRGGSGVGMQAGSRWRLALASLRRRVKQNTVQAAVFSLAITLLLMLLLVRTSLMEEWRLQLPEGTPNHFLLNISEQQVDGVAALLSSEAVKTEQIYPMVRGRLVAVNDQETRAYIQAVNPDEQHAVEREMNLSWSDSLPEGNALVAGEWWSSSVAGNFDNAVSVEAGIAKRLSLGVGDKLTFLIGSQKLIVTVYSLRELDWNSMKPNFFMLMPKATLYPYPATYMTSFYLTPEQKPVLNALQQQYATVSVIAVDSIISQIRTIISHVSAAVELVLSLIVSSALLVLVASVQASLDTRYRESAILRALGAREGLVMGSLLIEFVTLGLIAGLVAAFSAELAAYFLQTYALDMQYIAHPWVWLLGPLIGGGLIGVTGYLSCATVVRTPPVAALRNL